MQTPIFISHGAPTISLSNSEAANFLKEYGKTISKPKAVLIISAHNDTKSLKVSANNNNEIIYDYFGFPKEFYEIKYNSFGSIDIAQDISDLFNDNGILCELSENQALDHGAWIPLCLMFPQPDFPIIALSIQSSLSTGHHYEIGRILKSLSQDNILIIASGSFTHNLRELDINDQSEPVWSKSFSDWFDKTLQENRVCDLLAYRRNAPFAEIAHPTEEHLLPLFVALGAKSDDTKIQKLHDSVEYGSLRMNAYTF